MRLSKEKVNIEKNGSSRKTCSVIEYLVASQRVAARDRVAGAYAASLPGSIIIENPNLSSLNQADHLEIQVVDLVTELE